MPRSGKLKKVVVFGGGTGLSTITARVEKLPDRLDCSGDGCG